MENKKLIELIDKLHKELDKMQKVDAETMALLKKVTSEITELSEKSEDEDENVFSESYEYLQDFITQYEVEHPRLTASLNQICRLLSSMGI